MLLTLPDYTNPATLVQSFNNFFTDKIAKIMANIDARNKNTLTVLAHLLELDEQSTPTLTCFGEMTEDKIKNHFQLPCLKHVLMSLHQSLQKK